MLTRSKARQMRAAPVAKKSTPVKPTGSKKASKKGLACFRKTRKSDTPKGKAGSKYTICVKSKRSKKSKKSKKTKKSQKGGFVRGGSVQQFVQSLFK
jgi:hypothetical protein